MAKEKLRRKWKVEVYSEYTRVGTKQNKKQENDQWRLLTYGINKQQCSGFTSVDRAIVPMLSI